MRYFDCSGGPVVARKPTTRSSAPIASTTAPSASGCRARASAPRTSRLPARCRRARMLMARAGSRGASRRGCRAPTARSGPGAGAGAAGVGGTGAGPAGVGAAGAGELPALGAGAEPCASPPPWVAASDPRALLRAFLSRARARSSRSTRQPGCTLTPKPSQLSTAVTRMKWRSAASAGYPGWLPGSADAAPRPNFLLKRTSIVSSSPRTPRSRFEIAGARSNGPVTTRVGPASIVGAAATTRRCVRSSVGRARSRNARRSDTNAGARCTAVASCGAPSRSSAASGCAALVVRATADSVERPSLTVAGSRARPASSEPVLALVVASVSSRAASERTRPARCDAAWSVTASASAITARNAAFWVLTSASARLAATSPGRRSSAARFRSSPRPSSARASWLSMSCMPVRSLLPNVLSRSSKRGATSVCGQRSSVPRVHAIVGWPSILRSGAGDRPGSKAT